MKKELRRFALSKRKEIIYEQNLIFDKIKPYLENKKIIGLYYPLKYELDLLFLIKEFKNIKFVFPKVFGEEIRFLDGNIDTFKKGKFNVLEPQGTEIDKDLIDLIIVPGLIVNSRGYRIGYGKGYYDRYLKDYKNETLILISKELYLDFKEEKTDVAIKEVIVL